MKVQKGDQIRLTKQGKPHLGWVSGLHMAKTIKIGTEGKVIAKRSEKEFLVKFKGARGLRHTTLDQLELIANHPSDLIEKGKHYDRVVEALRNATEYLQSKSKAYHPSSATITQFKKVLKESEVYL